MTSDKLTHSDRNWHPRSHSTYCAIQIQLLLLLLFIYYYYLFFITF